MPRDVTTRWNSTYDMLKFALEYRKAIDTLTADRQNELRNYELSEREWTIAAQLSDVLKVCDVSDPRNAYSSFSCTGLERCDIVLLAFNAYSCYRYSGHGLHQRQPYCTRAQSKPLPGDQSLSGTWKEDPEPVLLSHGYIGSVPCRYGYELKFPLIDSS